MSVRLDDPEYWQARAEETRSFAEQIADYGSKAVLFRIAVDYERIAARAAALTKTSMSRKKLEIVCAQQRLSCLRDFVMTGDALR
jgi:hypothetical protein